MCMSMRIWRLIPKLVRLGLSKRLVAEKESDDIPSMEVQKANGEKEKGRNGDLNGAFYAEFLMV